eukprot:277002_1
MGVGKSKSQLGETSSSISNEIGDIVSKAATSALDPWFIDSKSAEKVCSVDLDFVEFVLEAEANHAFLDFLKQFLFLRSPEFVDADYSLWLNVFQSIEGTFLALELADDHIRLGETANHIVDAALSSANIQGDIDLLSALKINISSNVVKDDSFDDILAFIQYRLRRDVFPKFLDPEGSWECINAQTRSKLDEQCTELWEALRSSSSDVWCSKFRGYLDKLGISHYLLFWLDIQHFREIPNHNSR